MGNERCGEASSSMVSPDIVTRGNGKVCAPQAQAVHLKGQKRSQQALAPGLRAGLDLCCGLPPPRFVLTGVDCNSILSVKHSHGSWGQDIAMRKAAKWFLKAPCFKNEWAGRCPRPRATTFHRLPAAPARPHVGHW